MNQFFRLFLVANLFGCVIPTPLFAATAEIPPLWSPREAVAYAIKYNPDIAMAIERIAMARSTSQLAESTDYPQLNIQAEYSATNNPMYSFGNILNQGEFSNNIDFNDPGVTDRLGLMAGLSYRLYNGGKDRATKDSAAAEIEMAGAKKIETQQLLSFEVIKSYQAIIQAEQMVTVYRDTKGALEASYMVAKARYDAGDLLQQELLAIEAQLASVSEKLITAEHNLALAKHSFLTLLGLPNQDVTLQKEITPQQLPAELGSENRQEFKVLAALEKKAEAELAKAEGNNLPTVDTFANYTVEYGPETSGDGNSWGAGVRMNYNLFDAHKTNAAITTAKAQLREISAQKMKLELAINLEIEKARLSFEKAKKMLSVTKKAETAAFEAARLNRNQFKEGTVLASTLIDYESRLASAKARQRSAAAEYIVAIANLRRAAGYFQFDN